CSPRVVHAGIATRRPGDDGNCPRRRQVTNRTDQFEATIAWSSAEPLLPGRSYLLRLGAQSAVATPGQLKYKLDPATGMRLAARELANGETAVGSLFLDSPISVAHSDDAAARRFLLIDQRSGAELGRGELH